MKIMQDMTQHKPINIAIIAMGGQGGGVLSKWIIDTAEREGYIAQYTSVPGVAQRTGTTIYYIELFPEHLAEQTDKPPVLALTPTPGDLDIVIASEMMEAGRALMRGFVDENTTLIASSHRDYAIVEKQELGDGRRETSEIIALCEKRAGKFICFDMDDASRREGAVISSVLFGALAASGALPFLRGKFEQTVTDSGKMVPINLKGFSAGFDRAQDATSQDSLASSPDAETASTTGLIGDMQAALPGAVHPIVGEGMKKLADYQDVDYARKYLGRIQHIAEIDARIGGQKKKWRLTRDVARYLALAMAYDDVIRVADLKTRRSRFQDFRENVKAEEGQLVNVSEFMHPRWQEVCEILPKGIGRFLLSSPFWTRLFSPFFKSGRRITTTKLPGFVLLFTMGRLRPLRRSSLRFKLETSRIGEWLSDVELTADLNYDLACEIAGLQRLIKGYGDTHGHGLANVERIRQAFQPFRSREDAANLLADLKEAALKDDEGLALAQALSELSPPALAA